MRVCHTGYLIDRNRPLIADLYEARLGGMDLDSGSTMRALCELRLYRLPPYFDIPTKVKGRIQNAGTLLHDAENPLVSARLERELLEEESAVFTGVAPLRKCKGCDRHARIMECGTCAACEIKRVEAMIADTPWHDVQRMDSDEPWHPLAASTESLSAFKSEYRRFMKPEMSGPYEPWTTPKKVLLAAEIGCVRCKKRVEPEWLWNEDLRGWSDGLCPECENEGEWSIQRLAERGPRWYRRTRPRASYDRCVVCGQTTSDYALWGMCHACYSDWQLSYYDDPSRLAYRFGALACLLVWPSNEWVKHLRAKLPSTYVKGAGGSLTGELKEFIPRKKRVARFHQPKTLEEAGIDIDKEIK